MQAWIKKEMASLGLEWDTTSAQIDALTLMTRMIETTEHCEIDGKYHFQRLADGVSCYRHLSVCNVGLKLFHTSPNFNSLTALKML